MARCPKCDHKLRLTDWRPECPACGVNMVYYKANDRILEESEKAEIEHARSQPLIDRAKAAFFGSPPAIARVVLSVLPLGALFLPLATLRKSGKPVAVNALSVYRYLSETGFGALPGRAFGGDPIALSVVLLLLSAVLMLVCLICLVMSLGPHGEQRNLILNLLLLGSGAASAAVFAANASKTGDLLPGFGGGQLAFGAYVYLVLLAAILVYNLILAKKGLPVKHTVCYIGGLPSDEYFAMKAEGVPELEIRKKMVAALTEMQEKVRAEAAEAEAKAQAERAARK